MIEYSYSEEREVALYLSDILKNEKAKLIIINGAVSSNEEAVILSKFFWEMVNKSAEGDVDLPCKGSSQYWTEKLYNSIGGYLEKSGYEKEWNTEIDKA